MKDLHCLVTPQSQAPRLIASPRLSALRLSALCLSALCLSACAGEGSGEGGEGGVGDKSNPTPPSAPPTRLSELRYGALKTLSGAFTGAPLWVSNNPEDLRGFGLLSSTRPPDAFAPRGDAYGVPYPDLEVLNEAAWRETQAGCPIGEVRQIDLYLAHILSSAHLSGERRLSVQIEAGATGGKARWSARVGTTTWSDLRGYKTTRDDWLGARVAAFRLALSEGAPLEGQLTLAPGQRHTITTVTAESLVEGVVRLEVEGGCAAVHVIAHSGEPPTLTPPYAAGDVKWPGWYNGKGYGRAAGLYEGGEWLGSGSHDIQGAREAFGWRLFDAQQSPKAIARHGDSAEVLFGGYGVVYEASVSLKNTAAECVSAQVGFTSYADLALKSGVTPLGDARAPSSAYLNLTDPARRPSMLWNGPLHARYQLRGGERTTLERAVVLTPTGASPSDPTATASGLTAPLFRLNMEPGEAREVRVRLPVPGYIVAPAALTAEVTPCGG